MATIAENLQILKDSSDAIKQAIIDKGGAISGDISTWANAISGISGGSELLTFTLGDYVYFFQDGMTWDEYINITNPNNKYGDYHVYKSFDNRVHTMAQSVLILNGSLVSLTDTILPQVYNTTKQLGGSSD